MLQSASVFDLTDVSDVYVIFSAWCSLGFPCPKLMWGGATICDFLSWNALHWESKPIHHPYCPECLRLCDVNAELATMCKESLHVVVVCAHLSLNRSISVLAAWVLIHLNYCAHCAIASLFRVGWSVLGGLVENWVIEMAHPGTEALSNLLAHFKPFWRHDRGPSWFPARQ